LHIVSRIYDLVAIRCLDKNEQDFPNVGFINLEDIETGQNVLLRTSGKKGCALNNFLKKRSALQEATFKKHGVDCIDVCPSKPFIGDIVLFFRRRMMY